jgi:hypothetical protein
VRLVPLAGVLVLAVGLLAGCGGGNDRAKVEASLRQYISGFSPDQGPFPIGAGPPRVRNNSCTDRHVKVKKGQALISRTLTVYLPDGRTLVVCRQVQEPRAARPRRCEGRDEGRLGNARKVRRFRTEVAGVLPHPGAT